MRSSSSDQPERVLIARRLPAALEENAARIAVLQRIETAASAAQPEMLDGMSVRRFLAGRMIFMETKELALVVIKGSLAIGVCTNREHEHLISADGPKSATGPESRTYVDLRML